MDRNYNLTEVYKDYKGKWVALDSKLKKVIASGRSAKAVYDKAVEKEGSEITLFKVPSKDVAFAGLSR